MCHYNELDSQITQSKESKESKENANGVIIGKLIKKVESYKKSSILLLGYSIEMYLKAGLVRLHQYNDRDDFEKLLRKKYSHNLSKVAKLLGMPLTPEEINYLDRLKDLVLDEARYPITPLDAVEYVNQVNSLNHEVWSADQYQAWLELADKVSDFVRKIDNDSSHPASFSRYNIDDGYCVLRFGGNLPDFLLTKYSAEQKKNGNNNPDDLRKLLIEQLPEGIDKGYLKRHTREITVLNLEKYKW